MSLTKSGFCSKNKVLNDNEKNSNNLEKEEMDYNYCDIDGEIRMFLPTSHCSVNNIFNGLIFYLIKLILLYFI